MASGCLEWQGSFNTNGYPQIGYHGKRYIGGRLVWKLMRDDPGKLFVCHKCDNKKCLDTEHLFLGDAFDNMRDKIKKGRDHNLKKKVCKRGHSLENAYVFKSTGRRQCRVCARITRKVREKALAEYKKFKLSQTKD